MTNNKEKVAEFEKLRRAAATITDGLDMRKLCIHSAYLQGARKAILALCDEFPQIFKGKEGVYNKAVVDLATSSLRNTDLFLTREYELHFRNHEHNKKGKCIRCEAYFAEPVTVSEEVK